MSIYRGNQRKFIEGRVWKTSQGRRSKGEVIQNTKEAIEDLVFLQKHKPEIFDMNLVHFPQFKELFSRNIRSKKIGETIEDEITTRQKILDILIKYRKLPEFKALLDKIDEKNKFDYMKLSFYFAKRNIDTVRSEQDMDQETEKTVKKQKSRSYQKSLKRKINLGEGK